MKKIFLILSAALLIAGCSDAVDAPGARQSAIYPDYMDVTVPCNIAPLNFVYTAANAAGNVTTFSWNGGQIEFKGPRVEWNQRKWKKMLSEARGGEITVTTSPSGLSWKIYVSQDEIDYGLNYRLVQPGYEVYSKMGIYERDLTSFDEHPLLENTEFEGCVNCHSYNRGDPSAFSLHIRGDHGATIIRKDGEMAAYNTKTDHTLGFCVYPYWHPSGDYIIYSTNNTRQGFHMTKDKLIEVFDNASDLQVYDVRTNELITSPLVKVDGIWETFPSFSPDGRTIYFCAAAEKSIPEEVTDIKYNLCKIDFDPSTGTFGDTVTVLIDAASAGRSISFPRPTYDGRYLMYTSLDYGQFAIWHHEADLWLYDLQTGQSYPLDAVNSPDTESYHTFSSSSKWFVFTSRRDDGLFTRLYISHIDGNGQVTKPFMLPQRKPDLYYRDLFMSYNVPEFVTAPVRLDKNKAQKIIDSDIRIDYLYRSEM